MLTQKLKSLPSSSGVYRFFDKEGRLLYVGKAKVLKNRVKSYFRFTPTLSPAPNLSPRIHKMISECEDMGYIVVDNEFDALILENSLIKQLKPKYNILLRDDKTYPYIFIDWSLPYPRFEITRKILKGSHIEYFGPFTSGARDILESIYEGFKLVQKKSCLNSKKACLFHQIDRCLAPCVGAISVEDYKLIAKEAKEHIQNRKLLLKQLSKKMELYAESLRFEDAAKLRDRIETISSLKTITLDRAKLDDSDIFTITTGKNRGVSVKMFMREGKIVSSTHSFFKVTENFDLEEAYERLLLGHYKEAMPLPPKQILIPTTFKDIKLCEDHISNIVQKKVTIVIPQIGERKRIVTVALKNGEELLKSEKREDPLLDEIALLLNLQNRPDRVEVFDTSSFMGQGRVGGMIVYENGFVKNEYKRYNLEGSDEYSMMREMLTRRALDFKENPPPDLWLIDGGVAQLNIAKEVIASSGANVDTIAIAKEKIDAKAHRAKGGAEDSIYFQSGVLKLGKNDKRLQFLQRLRDESHRYAISFFRAKKQREDRELEILKVKGVGEGSVKKLINYFGTFEAIDNASFEDIEKVVGKGVAKALKQN